jgi:uncharacterized protein
VLNRIVDVIDGDYGMSLSSVLPALLGGVLIGVAAAALLAFEGRIAGVSGTIAGLVSPRTRDRKFRVAFLAGLALGGAAAAFVSPSSFGAPMLASPALVLASGALVGIGTRLGEGCTSGHGVCGIGRLSRRSTAATLTFMATGAIAALAVRLAFGGAA